MASHTLLTKRKRGSQSESEGQKPPLNCLYAVPKSITKREINAAVKKCKQIDQTELKSIVDNLTLISSAAKVVISQKLPACLIFAQNIGGSAVCIHPHGYILTNAHCVLQEDSDVIVVHFHILLFSSGVICVAKVVACDIVRDIALLHVEALYDTDICQFMCHSKHDFPFVSICNNESSLVNALPLVCVGQPISKKFPIIDITTGIYKGIYKGRKNKTNDVEDNSEIGQLMHTCWTYWGHSGAPLISYDGHLMGLHSSWDEDTLMRHGIHLIAIKSFIAANVEKIV